jgi:anaphase-promoting complex subunit 6
MYLGMEYAKLKNWRLAEEFLQVALGMCHSDPLLHNEIGYVYYETKRYRLRNADMN